MYIHTDTQAQSQTQIQTHTTCTQTRRYTHMLAPQVGEAYGGAQSDVHFHLAAPHHCD